MEMTEMKETELISKLENGSSNNGSHNDKHFEELRINSLYFNQKQNNRPRNNANTLVPVQVVNGKNEMSIGFPPAMMQPDYNHLSEEIVIGSRPDFFNRDKFRLKGFIYLYTFICFINILFTSLLFFNADGVDNSKVSTYGDISTHRISTHRSSPEIICYVLTIINLVYGQLSVTFLSSFGLTTYTLGSLLLFFIGYVYMPYFLYCIRYLIDVVQIYIALTIRSKLMYCFLPARGR
jgi:hypothetical protein